MRSISLALLLPLTAVACTRANLDAIVGPPATDGGGEARPDADLSSGCSQPALSPGDKNVMVQVGAVARSFLLHVPPPYDGTSAVPLVLDFHGLSGSGSTERSMSPYPAALDAAGVIMAFPTGVAGPSGAAWNVGPCCVADVDDVAFARAVVTQIEASACIDPSRVYAVGFSMGGGMAHYLACHAADVFAAVAPASFDLLAENVNDCLPPRPIAVISFRGTADTLVPYAGGPSSVVTGMPVTFLGADGTFQRWASINQCQAGPSAQDSSGCARYSRCAGNVEVVLCSKSGGQQQGDPALSWPFLTAHPL
jgi:polyhydroxybutyrate depolymerase